MRVKTKLIPSIILLFMVSSCNNSQIVVKNEESFPTPPKAQKSAQQFEEFGNIRVDNYYWIRDKEDSATLAYLKEEGEYTQAVMEETKELQEKIYAEILGRIKEEDESYPLFSNGYHYYSRTQKGKQYRVYCRREGSMESSEEVIFDINKMAEGKKAFRFVRYSISPNNKLAAYSFNETGSFAENKLRVKDLKEGSDLEVEIDKVSSYVWANDNKTLFYTVVDAALRPYRVYRHTLGSKERDKLIYEERDPLYNTYLYKSKTDDYLFIGSNSSYTSEVQILSANNPTGKFVTFMPREKGVEYSISHHKDKFYIYYKDSDNLNGMIYTAPIVGYGDRNNWEIYKEHNPKVRIEGIDLFEKWAALDLREGGLNSIEVRNLQDGTIKKIAFPEPVYTVVLSGNPEYSANTIRYNYTSLNRPVTLYQYNMESGESEKLKEQEIPSGFNPENYTVERLWATAPDGVEVPMAIVYKKGLKRNGKNPALLYSYGSYGISSDVFFSTTAYSLIDRGFIFAIAQIRGGSDLGEQWYEDGKLLNKKNSFTDFIASAQKLIDEGYTSPTKLAAMGGSAGGLLVGAVANMRPDLFQTIVAQVPFVDVINTMLDTSLPLTTQEYEEWGNPTEEEYYRYILSYSPYDNIEEKEYPNILATGGLNDSQVGFHEPTKWVAKLREMKSNKNLVLLYMNMDSGHGGATGRYDRIRESAFEYAFILNRVGIEK
ncbi:MAG: S9 family peptidase [Bacteroidales bacterium]